MWAAVAASVAVIGAGMSAYGMYQSGQNAKDVANYNSDVAKNAAIDSQRRGTIAAAEHREKVKQMIGTQRASMAANGLMLDTGTPLDIQVETAGMGELDALRIMSNAGRESDSYLTKAKLSRVEGRNAAQSSSWQAGASLLSGAGNAYFGYKSASRTKE